MKNQTQSILRGLVLSAALLLAASNALAQSLVTVEERYGYDDAGRLVRATYGSDAEITYTYDADGNLAQVVVAEPVGVATQAPDLPTRFALHAAYPNPFNPSTAIAYDVKERTHVRLEVFDVLGRSVATLVNGPHEAGRYQTVFDARGLASGVYLYRIVMGPFTATRSIVLVR
ncbi:MAG TPA: T9SS type A sorting domain-containing protein [Rhodothermales bacterium]